jgi:Flp pilus assembly protein TadG
MNGYWTVLADFVYRLAACRRGAVTMDFALIAIAMLIGIAVALDDIGTTLMASRAVASGIL